MSDHDREVLKDFLRVLKDVCAGREHQPRRLTSKHIAVMYRSDGRTTRFHFNGAGARSARRGEEDGQEYPTQSRVGLCRGVGK